MSLTFGFTAAMTAQYSATKGLMAGAGTVARQLGLTLANGTAAGQADGIFTADTTVQGGSEDAYFLAAGLRDLYGDQLEFTAVKFLMVEAASTNTAPLLVGGGTFGGPFGDPSNTLTVAPGDSLVLYTASANGWAVADGSDQLPVSCTDAAAYKLTLVGVSSAVSPPAWTVHPEIIGTPAVGVELFCTDGDVSGSPDLAYQWMRGGQKIIGAEAASYTPVMGDAGKQLARTTLARNAAGQTSVTTTPKLLPAVVTGGGSGGSSNTPPGAVPLSPVVAALG